MDIVQTFYDSLATQYDKLFYDWQSTVNEQAVIMDKIFSNNGFDKAIDVLDCACGIGTQAIGLSAIGYNITGSDISEVELCEARNRAKANNVNIDFFNADFRNLAKTFDKKFDVVIAMDNALPHMLTITDLKLAIKSIISQIKKGGMFVASIRDYDALLESKPPYSPPYIHKNDKGQRVSFQTWEWKDNNYKLTQYIIDDEGTLGVSKFECEYRATKRDEITQLLMENGCNEVEWLFPADTGFYQPIVVGKK